MKTISLRQPWAYLLCAGVKDVENRTWKLPEKYKGETVLIHASAKLKSDLGSLLTYEQRLYIADHSSEEIKRMRTDDFNFSAIIGSVRFVDCIINHPSIWAEKTEVYNSWCKSNGCENYIEWDTGYGECVSCKLVGQSYNIDEIAGKCPFKKDAKNPIYNWIVEDAVLFDKPILNVKGKLSFWDYDLPEEYEKLLK